MKKYMLLTLLLVMVDQALSAWALAQYANNEFYTAGLGIVLRYGRVDHGLPFAQFLPSNFLVLGLMALAAACFKYGPMGGYRHRAFAVPMAMQAAVIITQSVDMVTRGYGVNYWGFSVFTKYGFFWMLKLTDFTGYMAWTMVLIFILEGLVSHGVSEARRGNYATHKA